MKLKAATTTPRFPGASCLTALALGAGALFAAAPAQAGLLDSLFGKDAPKATAPKPKTGQRLWTIREFTQIELVVREPGAPENSQPVQIPLEPLRQQLAQIETVGRDGQTNLFSADEISDLAVPLAQALAAAGPQDDVLLLSASRREGGILNSPTAVTARLFVQGDALQMIVHDARFDFYDNYRGTYNKPRFTFGSRQAAATAQISSPSAKNRRPDWLAIPLHADAAATPASRPADLSGTVPAALPAARPPVDTPTHKPLDAAGSQEIERRLETVKRLHDKGLITEDEYQQKRKEILQLL